MKKNLIFLLSSCLLCAAACSTADAPEESPAFYRTENLPSAFRVAVKQGRSCSFELEENVTTGYSWTESHDPALCTVKLTRFSAQSELMGAPGRVRVEITPLTKVPADVTLRYVRPWEKDVKPIRQTVCTAVPE